MSAANIDAATMKKGDLGLSRGQLYGQATSVLRTGGRWELRNYGITVTL